MNSLSYSNLTIPFDLILDIMEKYSLFRIQFLSYLIEVSYLIRRMQMKNRLSLVSISIYNLTYNLKKRLTYLSLASFRPFVMKVFWYFSFFTFKLMFVCLASFSVEVHGRFCVSLWIFLSIHIYFASSSKV